MQLLQTPRQAKMAGVSPAEQAGLSALGFYPTTYNPAKTQSTDEYLQYLQAENLRKLYERFYRTYGATATPPAPYEP